MCLRLLRPARRAGVKKIDRHNTASAARTLWDRQRPRNPCTDHRHSFADTNVGLANPAARWPILVKDAQPDTFEGISPRDYANKVPQHVGLGAPAQATDADAKLLPPSPRNYLAGASVSIVVMYPALHVPSHNRFHSILARILYTVLKRIWACLYPCPGATSRSSRALPAPRTVAIAEYCLRTRGISPRAQLRAEYSYWPPYRISIRPERSIISLSLRTAARYSQRGAVQAFRLGGLTAGPTDPPHCMPPYRYAGCPFADRFSPRLVALLPRCRDRRRHRCCSLQIELDADCLRARRTSFGPAGSCDEPG